MFVPCVRQDVHREKPTRSRLLAMRQRDAREAREINRDPLDYRILR
jgi:hypothetical protein